MENFIAETTDAWRIVKYERDRTENLLYHEVVTYGKPRLVYFCATYQYSIEIAGGADCAHSHGHTVSWKRERATPCSKEYIHENYALVATLSGTVT